jgi:hypothetical protein
MITRDAAITCRLDLSFASARNWPDFRSIAQISVTAIAALLPVVKKGRTR